MYLKIAFYLLCCAYFFVAISLILNGGYLAAALCVGGAVMWLVAIREVRS